ncbi:hypothetical protein [Scytonema sp. PRP1]|uniref:hypothetical protein n=1 Tax=Scytonema sp. PRP1 TaxID=3120513 RepID=UPI002FD3B715
MATSLCPWANNASASDRPKPRELPVINLTVTLESRVELWREIRIISWFSR